MVYWFGGVFDARGGERAWACVVSLFARQVDERGRREKKLGEPDERCVFLGLLRSFACVTKWGLQSDALIARSVLRSVRPADA